MFSDVLALSCNKRLELLESFLSEPDGDKKLNYSLNLEDNFKSHQFSIDALLDTFILLYDECSNSSLRREKSVSDFLKLGKFKNHFFIACSQRAYLLVFWNMRLAYRPSFVKMQFFAAFVYILVNV